MKTKLVLLIIILFGLFMRSYQLVDRFYYDHDTDLSAWIVKDIVVDHHFRLIGQLTSSPGIFIGSLFYYVLIPFYWLTNLDPVGSLGLPLLIGLGSLISIYYVFSRLYDRKTGLLATLIFAGSFGLAMTERRVVPTTPVFLWSIWFYYFIHRLLQAKPKYLVPLGIMFALVWHLNLALGLLAPLVILAVLVNFQHFKLSHFVLPIFLFIVFSAPLLVFEARHDFIQSRSLISSFNKTAAVSRPFSQKINHVLVYATRNLNSIIWDRPNSVSPHLIGYLVLSAFAYLVIVKQISRLSLLIYLGWFGLYLLFFSLHPINLSEYYLDGLAILFVAILAIFFARLSSLSISFKVLVALFFLLFLGHNLHRQLTFTINHSGYVDRKQLVSFIASDAQKYGYPCVSVSYITTPGNELGYRYLFWLQNLAVNRPMGGAPVYSIVFPINLVDRVDHTFGALGLVLPQRNRYTSDGIGASCSGLNENLTYPMFGFTN